jgi:hypothetical protein
VLIEAELRPGAAVAAPHVHALQTEAFKVLEGRVGILQASSRPGHSAGRELEEGAMIDLPSTKFGVAAAEGRWRGWSSAFD